MFYRYLNEQFRRQMRNHELTDDELRQAADKMKAKQKKTFIAYVIIEIIIAILFTLAFIWEKQNSDTPVELSAIIITIVFFVVGGYVLPMGILKFQFNRELKKDYPHLYEECKL